MINRIDSIFSERKSRKVSLRHIRRAILNGKKPHLSGEEIHSLKRELFWVNDREVLIELWNIAKISESDREIHDYACLKIEDLDYSCRKNALSYLGCKRPESVEALIEKFKGDPDPYIVYELALLRLETAPDEALAMMIEIIPLLDAYDHETFDAISLFCEKFGTKRDLELFENLVSRHPELETELKSWKDWLGRIKR